MYNNKLVYNKNFSKTKTKSCRDETTDFDDKGVPKVDSNYTCLAEISLDSILKTDENYFPQVFLKNGNVFFKKVIGHIIDDLENSFYYSDED